MYAGLMIVLLDGDTKRFFLSTFRCLINLTGLPVKYGVSKLYTIAHVVSMD